MAERLSDRPALCLERLAGLAIARPGVGEGRETDLVEPGLAVADQDAERAPGHAKPAFRAFGQCRENVVEAALLAGDLLGQVAHVRDAFGIEMRPVVQGVDNARAGA